MWTDRSGSANVHQHRPMANQPPCGEHMKHDVTTCCVPPIATSLWLLEHLSCIKTKHSFLCLFPFWRGASFSLEKLSWSSTCFAKSQLMSNCDVVQWQICRPRSSSQQLQNWHLQISTQCATFNSCWLWIGSIWKHIWQVINTLTVCSPRVAVLRMSWAEARDIGRFCPRVQKRLHWRIAVACKDCCLGDVHWAVASLDLANHANNWPKAGLVKRRAVNSCCGGVTLHWNLGIPMHQGALFLWNIMDVFWQDKRKKTKPNFQNWSFFNQ